MDDQAIRAALERHWSDVNDQDVVHEIYHDDVVLELPQGGERLVGLANVRAMREAHPAKVALTTARIRGSGELWVAENVLTYDGGKPVHAVNMLEFRDGKVVRETIYFGDQWDPPAWRAPLGRAGRPDNLARRAIQPGVCGHALASTPAASRSRPEVGGRAAGARRSDDRL